MTLIRLRGVTKTFPPAAKNAEPVVAVDDVNLDIAAVDDDRRRLALLDELGQLRHAPA